MPPTVSVSGSGPARRDEFDLPFADADQRTGWEVGGSEVDRAHRAPDSLVIPGPLAGDAAESPDGLGVVIGADELSEGISANLVKPVVLFRGRPPHDARDEL